MKSEDPGKHKPCFGDDREVCYGAATPGCSLKHKGPQTVIWNHRPTRRGSVLVEEHGRLLICSGIFWAGKWSWKRQCGVNRQENSTDVDGYPAYIIHWQIWLHLPAAVHAKDRNKYGTHTGSHKTFKVQPQGTSFKDKLTEKQFACNQRLWRRQTSSECKTQKLC